MKDFIILLLIFFFSTVSGQVEGWVDKTYKVKWGTIVPFNEKLNSKHFESPDFKVKTHSGDAITITQETNNYMGTKGSKVYVTAHTANGKVNTTILDLSKLEKNSDLDGAFVFANKVYAFIVSRNRSTQESKLLALEYNIKTNSFSSTNKVIIENKNLGESFSDPEYNYGNTAYYVVESDKNFRYFSVYYYTVEGERDNRVFTNSLVVFDSLFNEKYRLSYQSKISIEDKNERLLARSKFFLNDGAIALIENKEIGAINEYKPRELKTFGGIFNKGDKSFEATKKLDEITTIASDSYFFPDTNGWVSEITLCSKYRTEKCNFGESSCGFYFRQFNLTNKWHSKAEYVEFDEKIAKKYIDSRIYEGCIINGKAEIKGLVPIYLNRTNDDGFVICLEEQVNESYEKVTRFRNGSVYIIFLNKDYTLASITKVPKFQVWLSATSFFQGVKIHYYNGKVYLLHIENTENFDDIPDKSFVRIASNETNYSLLLTEVSKNGEMKNNVLYNNPKKKGSYINPNTCSFIDNKLSLHFISDGNVIPGWLDLK